MKRNPVVHFEMSYENGTRAAEFYAQAFGWKMQHLGAKMGDYVLAITTQLDKKGMAKTPGAVNGGLYKKGKDGSGTHLVISVDNLEKHMGIVTKAGGKILGTPMDIPGIGMFVMFKDSEGNKVGMLQPSEM